ncbi:JAB domain-containing protein, partial [Pseudomonas aeruginosa]
MSQLSLAFDTSLMIRDEQGRYMPATAEQILDAARKVIDQKVQRGAAFTSSELVKEYLIAKLGGFEHEVFSALFLDAKHRLIQYVEMFRGTIDSASVYPREVVKEALRKRLANTPPRFFQLAAWCPPVFGGHHFKPLAEDLPCQ